jgi:hypothetical protein
MFQNYCFFTINDASHVVYYNSITFRAQLEKKGQKDLPLDCIKTEITTITEIE